MALEASTSTIERVRKRFAEQGLEPAIRHRPRDLDYRRKLNGEREAPPIAVACTPPPVGSRGWPRRLLAHRLVERRYRTDAALSDEGDGAGTDRPHRLSSTQEPQYGRHTLNDVYHAEGR